MHQAEAAVWTGECNQNDAQDRNNQECAKEQRDECQRRDLHRAAAEPRGE
jgi:hypothetical protein